MRPIDFTEATKTLTKPKGMTDEECGSLRVFENKEEGYLISCWKMTWKERLRALLFGKAWLFVWFGASQPPVYIEVNRTVFEGSEEV